MKVNICAVGRLKRSPERELLERYLKRFAQSGRGVGMDLGQVLEVEGRGGKTDAERISRMIPSGSRTIALDERGESMTSAGFARLLAEWRDDGVGQATFIIGGADGLGRPLRESADLVLALGAMVWPHMLARVMLAEQLYRAVSILSNSPYHRE